MERIINSEWKWLTKEKNAIDKSVEIYDTYLDMLKDVTHSIKDERERARRERIIDEVFDKPLLVGSLNRKCVAHAKEIAPIYFNSSKEHTYKFTEGYILGNL